MKTTKYLIACCLSTSIGFAQIVVGDAEVVRSVPSFGMMGRHGGTHTNAGDLKKEDVDLLKATTTVVVLQDKDKGRLADYKKAASQVWTFNKMEFITQSDLSKYSGKQGYSFIIPSAIITKVNNTMNGTPSAMSSASFFLKYWMPAKDKKGNNIEQPFARAQLYVDGVSKAKAMGYIDNENSQQSVTVADNTTYYNLSPGYLKCYLAVINKYISIPETRSLLEEEQDNEMLKKLNKDTLFLPDYIANGTGMQAGKTVDITEIMKKYEHPYKILTADAMSNKIINAKKSTFIVSYINYISQDIITVFDAQSGAIALTYINHGFMNKLDDSDFKEISKKIAKAAK